MNVVYDIVVVTHLLGMAAVVGGWAAGRPGVSELMVWGARAQIVTGLVLVGMAEAIDSIDKDLDHAKIGVKLVVAFAVAAFAEMGRGRAKRSRPVPWMSDAAGGLALLNVIVAAVWN